MLSGRIKDHEEALAMLQSAQAALTQAIDHIIYARYEDAYPLAEDADAQCHVALSHLEELLP